MDNRGEFSYISPEKEKKSAARLLIIELIVVAIVLVVVGLFFAMNYFGILPLSKINPDLFGWLPRSGPTSGEPVNPNEPIATRLSVDNTVNADITATSDISQYTIEITDKEELIAALKAMDVYGRVYSQNAGDSTLVDTVDIHLTNIEQPEHKLLRVQEGTLYSSKTNFSKNKITIDIYISPQTLADNSLSASDKGMILQEALIVALYSYAHAYQPAEEIQFGYVTILKELGKSNISYFRIN